MDDYVLSHEFGNSALKNEEKQALFKSIGECCVCLFGLESNGTLRDTKEIIAADGYYVKLSRLVVRNLGYIVGSLIEIQYFKPVDEPYNEQIEELEDYNGLGQEDGEADTSFIGHHTCMTFDTTDSTFFKSGSLSKLYIDNIGEADIDDIEVFESFEDEDDEIFNNLMHDEATTLTIDDYFVVNTVISLLHPKIK